MVITIGVMTSSCNITTYYIVPRTVVAVVSSSASTTAEIGKTPELHGCVQRPGQQILVTVSTEKVIVRVRETTRTMLLCTKKYFLHRE